jgi:hypothetical protein
MTRDLLGVASTSDPLSASDLAKASDFGNNTADSELFIADNEDENSWGKDVSINFV